MCQIDLPKNHPTNKSGVSYVPGIIIVIEGSAVTATDTNPCLQEIYNLMEDFFF